MKTIMKPVYGSALPLIFAAVLGVTAPISRPCSAQASASQTYAFVFKDADITQVAEEILGNTLSIAYRVEPGVTGKMNFRIEQRLTKAQLLAALEGALANYDVVLVKDGETLVLRPRDKAQIGGRITSGPSPSNTIGYQVRALPINYGSAEEIAKVIETVTNAKMVLFSSDKLGLILLGGRSEELDNAVSTIAMFDQSALSDARIRFLPLANASATSVAADAEKVLKASGTASVSVLAMPRLNGVFAFSKSSKALDEVATLIQRLDVPSNDPAIKVWIYHPRGASAESLARTLNAMLGQTSEGQTQASSSTSTTNSGTGVSSSPTAGNGAGAGSFGGGDTQARIVADKDTNSIIVNAPEAVRIRLQDVIAQIDKEPAQVFIEASILEVSLTDDFNYGVDWKALSSRVSASSFSSTSTGFPTLAPGLTVNYVGNDISAAIRALSSKSKVKIISAPKITTIENGTARLQVGDQVPIVTQTAQSTTTATAPLVNTVDYRDTGVKLEVVPRISGTDRVALTVTQEVSSVAKTQTSGIDSPTIKQRRMESQLIVPEGTVVALGGLISSSSSDGDSGVPGLKDIPILGHLFKGRSVTNDRTELVVLLRVKILRDGASFDGILSALDADLRDSLRDGDWLAPH